MEHSDIYIFFVDDWHKKFLEMFCINMIVFEYFCFCRCYICQLFLINFNNIYDSYVFYYLIINQYEIFNSMIIFLRFLWKNLMIMLLFCEILRYISNFWHYSTEYSSLSNPRLSKANIRARISALTLFF